VDELFKVIQSLIGQGKSLIFISKAMGCSPFADRIMVLRNGRLVGAPPLRADRARWRRCGRPGGDPDLEKRKFNRVKLS
jgi:ABC-type sugar transport system ATPase subunit